jgi:hypothetical protein
VTDQEPNQPFCIEDTKSVTFQDIYRRAKLGEENDAKITIDGRLYIPVKRIVVDDKGNIIEELPL